MVKPLAASAILFVFRQCSFAQAGQTTLWTEAEKVHIRSYWIEPGRYKVEPSEKYAVRLTTVGSKWFWDYNRARGKGKTPPGQVPSASSDEEAGWEKWLNARVARDRYLAGCAAETLNAKNQHRLPKYPAEVAEPELVDPVLVARFGTPPVFAANVLPNKISVRFDDMTLTYSDNVDMRPRYAYFRFDTGVNSEGQSIKTIPAGELENILKDCGYDESDTRVFKSVSILEGGFDSINTYDTGYVSIGFIQFASLKEGGGSLGRALVNYKNEDPKGFDADFHQFGIEVTADEKLVALDIETREEKVGPEANAQIIKDKRLIAAFQRAGKYRPFRASQLKSARQVYWPMNDKVTVTIGGTRVVRPLSDFVRSEAGKAVFLDRKVNTGNIGGTSVALQAIADAARVDKADDLVKYEALLIKCMYYRFDPMKTEELGKPEPCEMFQSVLRRFGRD
jgi:hypothetical protein